MKKHIFIIIGLVSILLSSCARIRVYDDTGSRYRKRMYHNQYDHHDYQADPHRYNY